MEGKKGSVSTSTYTVAGKTLDDILRQIQSKGPKDPNDGKRYAGLCLGELQIDIKGGDLEFTPTPDGKKVSVIVKGGAVKANAKITLPKLASDKDLSPAAKKEWQRFLAATEKHEIGHHDSLIDVAKTVAKDIAAMTGDGQGKDEKTAKQAANVDLVNKIKAQYGSALPGLVTDDIKAYDGKTKHGESQGAKLDATIR
jgi:predicted secreted Zn-dependent protease